MTADFSTFRDGEIQVFQFNRSTDEAVAEWAIALEAYIQQTPKKRPFYILLDVSAPDVDFTAAARQHSKRIFSDYHAHKGYIAMLFAWRTSPYFGRLFFASLGKLNFKLNYFHQREAAFSWLEKMHAQEAG